MTIFSVMEDNPNPALREAIKAAFPDNYRELSPGRWLISASGTAQQVSEKMGLVRGSGFGGTVVFATTSYYGLHSSDLWDWIREKLESDK